MNVSIIMKLVDQVTGPARRMRTAVAVAMKGVEQARTKADKQFATAANIRQAAEGVASFARGARALVMAPIEAAENFQAAMSQVAAVAGAAPEEMAAMRDQALQLGAATSFSADQAAQGMFELAKNGFTAQEVMKAMPGTLDLAAASGTDLGRAAEISSAMLRSFRFDAAEAGRVSDVLAKTANMSAVDLSDMAETMKYAAPVASEFGMTLEQTAAMAGLLGNVGIKGSMAGTSLRTSLLNLANPRGQQKKALAFLNIDTVNKQTKQLRPLTEILGEIDRKTAGLGQAGRVKVMDAIFGSEGVTAMLELMRQVKSGGLEQFASQLVDAGGAADEMAKVMLDNSKGAAEQLSGAWQTLLITVGTTMLPLLTEARLVLASIVETVADWAKENPTLVKTVMIATAAVAAFATVLSGALFTASTIFAAKGLLILIGGWKGVAMAIYRFALPAWIRMSVAFIASPLGLLITGIIALVAAAVWLGFNWDKVTGIWNRFKNASLGVKVALAVVLGPLVALLSPLILMGFLAKQIIDNWDGITSAVTKAASAVGDFIAKFDNPVVDWLVKGKVGGFSLFDELKEIGGGASDVLLGPGAPVKKTAATKPTARTTQPNQKQNVEGLIRLEIEGAAARVREVRASGGVDLDVDAGLSMVAP